MTRQKVKKGEMIPNTDQSMNIGEKLSSTRTSTPETRSFSALSDLASHATRMTSNLLSERMEAEKMTFPTKLHHILSQSQYKECLTWTLDGRCIRVVDPFKFQEFVSLKYFRNASYTSFLVELEKFGFRKVTHARHLS